jgi:AcrR family transcriptional regulator
VSPTSHRPERPLRKDAERNRRRILEAAGEVFAECGVQATLDAVAERAGVGVGTVYRRFPDKEALIDALFEERIEAIAAIARECLAMDDAWDAFAAFFDRAVSLHAQDRALKDLVFSAAHGSERVARARARIKPAMEELVGRAQADGRLRADFAVNDAPLLQLMLTEAIEYAGDVEPDAWRRYLAMLLDGLRAEAASTPLAPPALTDPQLDAVMTRGLRPRR